MKLNVKAVLKKLYWLYARTDPEFAAVLRTKFHEADPAVEIVIPEPPCDSSEN